MFQARAHAKINLFLHVTGRRPDGYHELDSLAVFAETADFLRLEAEVDEGCEMSLTIDGPFSVGLDGGRENLVLRAADALREAAGSQVKRANWRMRLTKILPVASGIGGGSADAAAALRLLSAAWELGSVDLVSIAATLGADVPVCLAQKTQRMQGIGERLVKAPELPRCAMVLVNPGIAVSTPTVFRAWKESGAVFRPEALLPAGWSSVGEMVETLRSTSNDLQGPAITLYPVISDVLRHLNERETCLFARMSGSGATCFGLYEDLDEACAEAQSLKSRGWWAEAGWLQSMQD